MRQVRVGQALLDLLRQVPAYTEHTSYAASVAYSEGFVLACRTIGGLGRALSLASHVVECRNVVQSSSKDMKWELPQQAGGPPFRED
jgi:hypothetical protein